jgi:hypothetical protein
MNVGGNIKMTAHQAEEFEEVYSYDWYDGPRNRIANFNGKPYYFESQWEDINTDNPDSFKLSPISEELLSVAIRDWQLWQKWEEAYYQGLTTPESHPFLPENTAEGQRLRQILKDQLLIDEANCLKARAEFRPVDRIHKMNYGMKDLVVKWQIIKNK